MARDKTEWYPHNGVGEKYYGDDFYQSGSDQKYSDYLSKVEDACVKAGGTLNRKMKILEDYKNRKGGYSTYLFTSCDFGTPDTSYGSTRCEKMCKSAGVNCEQSGSFGNSNYTSCFIRPPSK